MRLARCRKTHPSTRTAFESLEPRAMLAGLAPDSLSGLGSTTAVLLPGVSGANLFGDSPTSGSAGSSASPISPSGYSGAQPTDLALPSSSVSETGSTSAASSGTSTSGGLALLSNSGTGAGSTTSGTGDSSNPNGLVLSTQYTGGSNAGGQGNIPGGTLTRAVTVADSQAASAGASNDTLPPNSAASDGPTVSPAQPGYTWTGWSSVPFVQPPVNVVIPTNQNVTASDWWLLWNGSGPVGLKHNLINEYGTPPVTILPGQAPAYPLTQGVSGGLGNVYTSIPPGVLVGPTGTGPCIGVIIVSPPDSNGNVTVWVYHFQATDNPNATLQNSGGFPPGSTVVLSGGWDTDPQSMGTLQSINTFLNSHPGINVAGYFNTPALYVNASGQFFVFESAIDTRDDRTIAQPPHVPPLPPADANP